MTPFSKTGFSRTLGASPFGHCSSGTISSCPVRFTTCRRPVGLGLVQRVLLHVHPLPIPLLGRTLHRKAFGVPVYLLEEAAAHAVDHVVRGEPIDDHGAGDVDDSVGNQPIAPDDGVGRLFVPGWRSRRTQVAIQRPAQASLGSGCRGVMESGRMTSLTRCWSTTGFQIIASTKA